MEPGALPASLRLTRQATQVVPPAMRSPIDEAIVLCRPLPTSPAVCAYRWWRQCLHAVDTRAAATVPTMRAGAR